MSDTKKIDDGGPAFPGIGVSELRSKDGDLIAVGPAEYFGMSLRDWFAGQALAGLVERMNPLGDFTTEEIAGRMSYRYADAMIAARKGN